MLRSGIRSLRLLYEIKSRCGLTARTIWTGPKHDPLRILFCGADRFSIYSLRALNELKSRRPDKIASLDVVCRPDKRGGRGMKQLRQVPIKTAASNLGLELHQIDSFTGWSPPTPMDLIVAVSFGLLVPTRILKGATYGGLNVHPSMLPALRGPAPIVHTLLRRLTHTGVTVQTMHPTEFDRGVIIEQTRNPGIPVPGDATTDHLTDCLGPAGARMLCDVIEAGTFVQPNTDDVKSRPDHRDSSYAPKLQPSDREIDWSTWSADKILLRDRVLGRLWDSKLLGKRVVFEGWERIAASDSELASGHGIGQAVVIKHPNDGNDAVAFTTIDPDQLVVPRSATIDGGRKGAGIGTILSLVKPP